MCVCAFGLSKQDFALYEHFNYYIPANKVWGWGWGIRWNQCPSVLDSGHCVFRMLNLSYTKLFIAVHCHGAQCPVKTFGCCLQGQGDSEGLYNQNGTV